MNGVVRVKHPPIPGADAFRRTADRLRRECAAATRAYCLERLDLISAILKGHAVTLTDAIGGVPTLGVEPPLITCDYRTCRDLHSWLDQDDSHGGARRSEIDAAVDEIEHACLNAASDCGLADFSIGEITSGAEPDVRVESRDDLGNVEFLLDRLERIHESAKAVDPNDRRLPAMESALKRIMDMMTERGDPETELCSFGEPAKRRQKWMIIFQDAEVGNVLYDADLYGDAEAELLAREAYHGASVQWNCTLFKVAEWSEMALKPLVDHESVMPPLAGDES